MALTDNEVYRLKSELGYPVLSVGAEPFVGIHAVFNAVVQTYLTSGAATTSSTAVVAAKGSAPVTLTLASAVGFTAGARVIVDVDARQEAATIQHVSGSTITLLLSLAHSGVYPITLEGGESIVRSILRKLDAIADKLEAVPDTAGIKAIVGEIEFFGGGAADRDPTRALQSLRQYWRNELARVLGVANLHATGGGSCVLT